MRTIQLTGAHNDKEVILDDKDYEKLKNYKIYYHIRGYCQVWLDGKNVLLHRLILNTPKGFDTDHINRNKLDNRRSNLRICSRGTNLQNQKHWAKSGYKGVNKNGVYWQANIYKNGKRYFLGNFSKIEDAVKSYNVKAKEFYGENAYINII